MILDSRCLSIENDFDFIGLPVHELDALFPLIWRQDHQNAAERLLLKLLKSSGQLGLRLVSYKPYNCYRTWRGEWVDKLACSFIQSIMVESEIDRRDSCSSQQAFAPRLVEIEGLFDATRTHRIDEWDGYRSWRTGKAWLCARYQAVHDTVSFQILVPIHGLE